MSAPNASLEGMTAARWHELYAAPGSGYPSVKELARRFGVSYGVIRRRLSAARVPLRAQGRQQELDNRQGKYRAGPNRGNVWALHTPEARAKAAEVRRGRAWKQWAAANGCARQRRETRPCSWCCEEVSRQPSRFRRGRCFCSLRCAQTARRFWERKGASACRPHVVDRLLRAWETANSRLDRWRESAEGLGATEAEIELAWSVL